MIQNVYRSLLPRNARVTRRRITRARVVLHHTAGNKRATPRDVARVHLDRGWPHIGYHYLINQAGVIFKTLPLSFRPICVRGMNQDLICIAYIGNYDIQNLTVAQVNATRHLLSELGSAIRIGGVFAHSDLVATLCPGRRALQTLISQHIITRKST